MNQSKVVFATFVVLMLFVTPLTQGKESGKLNSGTGCGCHSQTGSTVVTPSLSGTPTQYTGGQTYSLTISVSGGISGSNGGFSLDVDKGSFSYMGFAVNINSAGDSATHSITGINQRTWGLDWTAPNSGTGVVNFQLATLTSNNNGFDSGDRWGTMTLQVPENAPSNQPPSASNAMLNPTGAKTADDLTLSYSFSDPDGDTESGTVITWYKDSTALPQGTIPGMVVSSSQTSKNQQWYAEIIPSDGKDSGAIITSNVVTIQNTPPTFSAPIISPSQPNSGDVLDFIISNSDDDQDTIIMETLWYLDGTLVSELNNELSVPSLATRDGDQWYVEVRLSDSEDTTIWKTSQTVTIGSSTPINNTPVVSSISILPANPYTIDDLSVEYISNDVDGDTITDVEFQWYLDGNEVLSQTSGELPSSQTTKSQIWKAKVRVSDGTEWSNWAVSNPVVISNSVPVIDSVELDLNEAKTDQNITVSYSMTDSDGDTPSYPLIKWFKDGLEQPLLENKFTLSASQTAKEQNWTVSVKAGDGQGLSANELSKSVLIINSIPLASIQLSHGPLQDIELSISNTDEDGDLTSNEVYWYRNGFKEGSLDGKLTVPSQYLGPGQVWSVEVLPNDGYANGLLVTSQLTIGNLLPSAVIDIETTNLWNGEIVIISANNSQDSDGRIESYAWQWSDNNEGSGAATGRTISIIPTGSVTVILTVYDELGGSGYTSSTFQTGVGPKVKVLTAESEQANVKLEWQWNGPEATFEVLRNGASISTISETSFTDYPLISGPTDYTVRPIIDGNKLYEGSSNIEGFMVETVEPTSNSISSSGGLITGILFVLISLGTLALSFTNRRD